MNPEIKIIEKPDWVSWDDIHEVLWKAHAENRKKGINMALPTLSGDKIEEKIISEGGKIFLAIEGDKIVGTLALIVKSGKRWYNYGQYGYLCFGAVLPEYSGKGIYRSLYQLVETTAKQMELSVLTRDTNEKNARMLKITKQEGYHFVAIKACEDHFNIVRAKWLEECPYSMWYIKTRYLTSVLLTKLRFRMDPQKGKTKRFGI
jgi:GNAT superfamily N-acetyltransferase